MKDVTLSAFAVFFCQSPSFLAYRDTFEFLKQQGVVEAFCDFANSLLIVVNWVELSIANDKGEITYRC